MTEAEKVKVVRSWTYQEMARDPNGIFTTMKAWVDEQARQGFTGTLAVAYDEDHRRFTVTVERGRG